MAELSITQTFRMTGDWFEQAEALLDENHVVAVCDDEGGRVRFGSHVTIQAEQQKHVEVSVIYGRFVRDVRELTHMLNRSMPLDEPVEPTIEGLTEALRAHRPLTQHQYVIWHDADVMAEAAPEQFWQAADAMMGVAAEQEFSTEDRLVISRVLFIGGESLLRAKGLARWWPEGPNKPLWEVVSGLARPPVCAVRVINGSA